MLCMQTFILPASNPAAHKYLAADPNVPLSTSSASSKPGILTGPVWPGLKNTVQSWFRICANIPVRVRAIYLVQTQQQ